MTMYPHTSGACSLSPAAVSTDALASWTVVSGAAVMYDMFRTDHGAEDDGTAAGAGAYPCGVKERGAASINVLSSEYVGLAQRVIITLAACCTKSQSLWFVLTARNHSVTTSV